MMQLADHPELVADSLSHRGACLQEVSFNRPLESACLAGRVKLTHSHVSRCRTLCSLASCERIDGCLVQLPCSDCLQVGATLLVGSYCCIRNLAPS